MREQSRELSRRSILQSAIARAGVIAGPVTSTGFLDHQHRFGCVPSPGLPISSPVESDRVAEPWFQAQPRPKPIHSPRMADWYGNVADPIERLQVMGTMHQQSLDKCKDVIRSQASVVAAADCAAGFSNSGYPVNFNEVNRERDLRRQENIAEYAEFSDGQKWHPYQVGSWLLEWTCPLRYLMSVAMEIWISVMLLWSHGTISRRYFALTVYLCAKL